MEQSWRVGRRTKTHEQQRDGVRADDQAHLRVAVRAASRLLVLESLREAPCLEHQELQQQWRTAGAAKRGQREQLAALFIRQRRLVGIVIVGFGWLKLERLVVVWAWEYEGPQLQCRRGVNADDRG